MSLYNRTAGILLGLASIFPAQMACSDIAPRETVAKSTLEDVIICNYKLYAMAKYRDGKGIGAMGTAFALARKDNETYFVTAAHCFLPDKYGDADKVSSKYVLVLANRLNMVPLAELKPVLKNVDNDIGIMKTPIPFRVYNKVLDRACVKQGERVYSVGYPHSSTPLGSFSWGRHITEGIITARRSDNIPNDEYAYYSSAELDGGMSGGSSFVIRDGEPYIFGVNSFMAIGLNHKFGIAARLTDEIERAGLDKYVDKWSELR